MKQPIIFALDDDPQVLKALVRDVRQQFRKEYKVLSTTSAQEALESLKALKNQQEQIAMFITDQRMPEMLGVDFMEQAIKVYPDAKRVLLTAYSDTEAAIKAINAVGLHYYLLKPWNPPEDRLYPVMQDLLDEWQASYIPEWTGLKLLGYQWSPKSHWLKDFLSANLFPYQWLDVEEEDSVAALLTLNGIKEAQLPVVFFEDGSHLVQPGIPLLAEKLGLRVKAANDLYDVVIIGAGPAGLAAAVYGASEGLKTLLIEKKAAGGQAGTSSRIENYLGFPNGLSGSDLAHRAITQASRFGTEFLAPQQVMDIQLQDQYKILHLADGNQISARSLIITSGVEYRQLKAPGIEAFSGAGIYYGAAMTEAHANREKQVFIVGGGNSAGQAAMHLSKYAAQVYMLIRKPDLSQTMSQYLITQLEDTPNISVLPYQEVVEARGDQRLRELVLSDMTDQTTVAVPADALFIFIGARPSTDWIKVGILKNSKGYIETGRELQKNSLFQKVWKLSRDPYLLETCVPGIFAAGDVRAGAMNRVASAVGEGAMAIKYVHEYLTKT